MGIRTGLAVSFVAAVAAVAGTQWLSSLWGSTSSAVGMLPWAQSRIQGVAALAALGVGAAKGDGQIHLPNAGTWGTPPVEDWPESMPEFPPFEGWGRFIGADLMSGRSVVDGNLVVFTAGVSLYAFDLESGAQRWEYQLNEEYDWNRKILCTASAVICTDYSVVIGLDKHSGAELWRRSDITPLAVADKGIWAAKALSGYSDDSMVAEGLSLLDDLTGEEARTFDVGKIIGASRSVTNVIDVLAVANLEQILLVGADGSIRTIPRERPGWCVTLAQCPDRIVAFEYRRDSWDIGTLAEGYTESSFEELLKKGQNFRPEKLYITCYGFDSLAAIWHRPMKEDGIRYISEPEGATCAKDCCGFVANWQARLFSMSDGEDLFDAAEQLDAQPVDFWIAGELLYTQWFGDSGEQQKIQKMDFRTGESSQLADLPLSRGDQITIAPGVLVAARSKSGWYEVYSDNLTLVALRLDDSGELVQGEMRELSLPRQYPDLRERFLASSDPLADSGLMTEIVTSGINAVARLMEVTNVSQGPQLDALVSAAVYLHKHTPAESFVHSARPVLVDQLKRLMGPELAPNLIRWLDSKDLKPFHAELRGLLVQCGGAEAVAYLSESDALGYKGEHVILQPPYKLKAQEPYYTDLGEQAHNQSQWVKFTSSDEAGPEYVAYTAAGLMCERDIYLAVDNNRDGLYDEVWPTGLTDVFQRYSFPGGAHDVSPNINLKLQVDYGLIKITHHTPKLLTDEDGWQYFEETRFAATDIGESELRRDSDSDGLTDITEQLLMCDPQNSDTDGDGVNDSLDPTPNLDIARLDEFGRGILRALDYFFDGSDLSASAELMMQRDEAGHPFRAVYFSVVGADPVAFTCDPYVYGIAVKDAEAGTQFSAHNQTFPAFSWIGLEWYDWSLSPEELLAQHPRSYYEDATPEEMAGALEFLRTMNRISDDADCSLSIDLSWVGFCIDLEEVDGEFYPVAGRTSWIT